MPHAHLRDRAAKFTAHYSDGREAILLSVPKYDFSWQAVYQFQEPKLIPSGTRIVFDMTGGNSARNPANPDPARDVPWGDQTWDEMNAGWLRYRELAAGGDQGAHRHNGVAVTLALKGEGTHSLIDGQRVDWSTGAVQITPPTTLHSHHNRGSEWMRALPFQDEALHYYTRTPGFGFD